MTEEELKCIRCRKVIKPEGRGSVIIEFKPTYAMHIDCHHEWMEWTRTG